MVPKIRRGPFTLGLALVMCLSGTTAAQYPLTTDRARLAEIVVDTSVFAADTAHGRRTAFVRAPIRVAWVLPSARITHNSAIPFSLNDGPLWAGRGWNAAVTGGFALGADVRSARLELVAAPTFAFSQNLPFQTIPASIPGRSSYANPFHPQPASLDLPHRFGNRALVFLDPGQTAFTVAWPAVTVGATTASEWWGPGLRNALVMSENAAGIPRFFVRTTRPARTPAGDVDARLFTGALTQSRFFDSTTSENRTISGLTVTLRPAFDSAVTLGFSRVVYAPISDFASPFTMTLSRTLDAIVRWENLDGVGFQRSDQISALWARWVLPNAGVEVFGEWARMDLPRKPLELLTAAHHTGAWTFGFQWARPVRPREWLRLQSEFTYLEQSRVFSDRPSPDFYSGQGSPQGYTQRGQIIGASIGPGASSQWVAVDHIAGRWQLGAYVNRIRWDNDALYRTASNTFWDHDATLAAGVRGGWRARLVDYSVDLGIGKRFNYLFQNGTASPGGYRTVDVTNVTLALVATPR